MTGTVRLTGAPPDARPATRVTQDGAVCGASVPDESLVVSAEGGVRDAVVILRGVAAPASVPAPPVVIDNVGCRFVPRVQVAVRGQPVEVRSADPVLHNAHVLVAGEPEATVANVALARAGQRMDLTRRLASRLPPAGEVVLRLRCDVHPWMTGWLVVNDHPWAAVTDAAGRFTIRDVPPGTYTVAVWHERLGRAEGRIEVAAGATATSVIELSAEGSGRAAPAGD